MRIYTPLSNSRCWEPPYTKLLASEILRIQTHDTQQEESVYIEKQIIEIENSQAPEPEKPSIAQQLAHAQNIQVNDLGTLNPSVPLMSIEDAPTNASKSPSSAIHLDKLGSQ